HVVTIDHSTDMRKRLEHPRPRRAEIERIHLRGPTASGYRGRGRAGAECHALARAARPDDREVALDIRFEIDRVLALSLRVVGDAEHELTVGALTKPGAVVQAAQLVEPRLARRREARLARRSDHRRDQ